MQNQTDNDQSKLPATLQGALSRANGKPRRKLANNTYLLSTPHGACVVLHDTPIITYFAGDNFTITNGGYFSPTTRSRLNKFLEAYGYRIVQVKGEWFYCSLFTKSLLVPYKNGDTKQMIADRFAEVNA